ncbi:Hypothetical protein ABZS17I87_00719 [Kosakonia cowanii]
MARCLSGLRVCFACIAGWRCTYPAYGFVSPLLPDGAALIRPTGTFSLYCRMARCLSGLRVCFACIAGWRCTYPAYGFCRPGKRSATGHRLSA